jgi:ribonuclease P protein component
LSCGGSGVASKRLPRSFRLHRAEDFRGVLRGAKRRGEWLSVAVRRNAVGHCRLGMIVGRREVPGAVARNNHKRLIREVFRGLRQNLPSVDIVIRVLKQAGDARSRQALREELGELLKAVDR